MNYRDHKQTRAFLCFALVLFSGCSAGESTTSRIGCNGTINLANVSKGGACTRTSLLTNDHEAFEVMRFKTSCTCLNCTLEPSKLNKGETGTLKLTMDMNKEPEFIGSLLITIEGINRSGKSILEIRVLVDVVDQ